MNKNKNLSINNVLLIIIIILIIYILLKNDKKKYVFENFQIKENSKKYTKNHLVTEILIKSCKELNLDYKLLDTNIIKITHNNKSVIFNRLYNNLHSMYIRNLINDKSKTSTLLGRNNIPVAQHKLYEPIKSEKQIYDIINNHNIEYPVVVKPNDSTGGIKVFINISNKNELAHILMKNFLNKDIFRSKTQNIIIEKHINGESYRILCYKNKVLEIITRIPPFVIGNGIDNIKTLALKKNISKKNYPIIINELYINKKNKNLNTILKNGEKLIVNLPKINYGAYIKKIPLNQVHNDNIIMFSKINSILNSEFIGIDFMIPDLSKSFKNQLCCINEVNASPNFDVHYYANEEYSIKIPKQFLKLYFNI